MRLRTILAAASALAGVCYGQQALAADQPPPAAGATALQEVVVTAQKRAEDVQKIPLAVTPVLGAKLIEQGVTDVRKIGNLVPGVVLGQDFIYTQIDIRGVGANNDAPALDPAVAFNIDGVYQARDYGTYGSFYDIDRVEVLRGPQGTLYGRNAAGGSINVITNKPVSAFHAALEEELGDYGLVRTFGMVNAPVSDQLAVRLAFQQAKHDGYLTSGFNDQNSIAGRLQALYRPSMDVSLLLAGEFFDDHSNGAHTIVGLPYLHPSDPWYDPLSVSQAESKGGASSNFTDWALHAQLDVNLGPATLTEIPAFKHVHTYGSDPVVGVNSKTDIIDKSYSNELRLTSNAAGPLKWVIGGYFFREDDYSNSDYFSHSPFFSFDSITINPDIKEVSWAAFGQATYAISPNLRITGGLRYSIDSKSATGQDNTYLSFGGPAFLSGTIPDNFPRTTWHHLDWRVGVDFDLTPQSLLYANVATGYLEGGFNIGSQIGLLPNFVPEKLLAYTVGNKNRLFDDRVQLNWEAFYYDYKNYIVSVYLTQGAAVGQFALFNTPAKIYGGEIESILRASPSDTFNANLSLLHGRYGTFVQTFVSTGLTNLSGQTLEKSPSVSIQAGYEHVFELAHGDEVKFGVQTNFSSSYWTLFDQTPGSKQPSYTWTNLQLTYQSQGNHWHVQGYVDNIEGSAVIATAAPPNASSAGVPWLHIEAPRTFGVRFGVSY